MSRHELTLWIAATLAVAALVHVGAIYALPRVITARTLAGIGAVNTMHFGKPPDETSRRVVRPSPDLLYAACPFDLAQGRLRITARVPHATYWSVSAFDAATNNFFVRNDQQVTGDTLEIIVLSSDTAHLPLEQAPGRIVVEAPTEKGLILLRYLIDDEKDLPALDAIRHEASCGTLVRDPLR